MGGRRSRRSQVVGYKYYLGMHMVLCSEADAVTEIQVGERRAWMGHAATPGNLIAAPDLFGGDRKEGGVAGVFDVLTGAPGQPVNDYLQARLGGSVPAFRGVLSLVLRQMYIAANNPYLKPWAVRVRRAPKGTLFAYPMLPNGANPANIVHECLANTDWGLGFPSSSIGGSFYNAHWTLAHENFGLNLLWTRQQPLREFIQIVLDHINGVLYRNPQDGRFEIELVRPVGQVEILPLFGPDKLTGVEDYERNTWEETINEVIVVYTDAATGKPQAAPPAQNLANMHVQGGIVSKTVNYPGITDPALAARVAMRDLRALSVPLARMRLKATRAAADLRPGQAIRIYWPELGIHEMVVRVVGIDYGDTQSGAIAIDAVEDAFGSASMTFAGNDLPPAEPDEIANSKLMIGYELPYWEVARNSSAADLAYMDAVDTWLAGWALRSGGPSNIAWELHTGPSAGSLAWRAESGYGHFLQLPDLSPEVMSLGVAWLAASAPNAIAAGEYGYILHGMSAIIEAVEIVAVDPVAGTLDLARGVLDTVPRAHGAFTLLILDLDTSALEGIERAPGETVEVYGAARGMTAALPPAPAFNTPYSTFGRQGRPYPPGNLRINGARYPVAVAGDLVIVWSHRDRVQQTAYLVRQDEGDIGPEAGTTYTLRAFAEPAGILLREWTGIAGVSQFYTTTQADADNGGTRPARLRIELGSARAGLDSWQKHVVAFDWS